MSQFDRGLRRVTALGLGALFVLLGLLSIYPTVKFMAWRPAVKQGQPPVVDAGTLVRAQKSPERAAEPPPQTAAGPTLTALVVDDSITMRRVTQRLLERRGAKVFTARDGLDAITVLQEHPVDIILLDVEMPRMDGYQLATHVRNDSKLKDLPIIMITSRSGEKHRAKAIEIGVNDYLSKPYQESQLVAAIEALLGREL